MMDGGARRVTAHAVRTWHFADALRRAGHEILLCTVSQNLSKADPPTQFVERREKGGIPYDNVDMRIGDMLAYFRQRCDAFQPDGIVGVTTEPAGWVCHMRPTAPVWCDLHGWVMAEAQLKAARDGNDDVLPHFWFHERAVLRRADKISAVTHAHRFAVLGELATIGRLNRHNVHYDLVVRIPCSVDVDSIRSPSDRLILRRLVGQDNAFVVLWSGAFNTWTDPATLFEGLEQAMAAEPTVHFAATGGVVPGHADAVLEEFQARVERSPHRGRFHLLGWVEAERFADYVAAADLAVCADFPCLETSIGVRTRLLEAMAHGVPIVLTRGTELSVELEHAGAGWIVEPRNPAMLAERICAAARDRAMAARMGAVCRHFVEEHYSVQRTFGPLLEWAEHPAYAPDNALKRLESPTIIEATVNRMDADARALDYAEDIPAMARAQAELARLRAKWPLRLWRWLKRRFR